MALRHSWAGLGPNRQPTFLEDANHTSKHNFAVKRQINSRRTPDRSCPNVRSTIEKILFWIRNRSMVDCSGNVRSRLASLGVGGNRPLQNRIPHSAGTFTAEVSPHYRILNSTWVAVPKYASQLSFILIT